MEIDKISLIRLARLFNPNAGLVDAKEVVEYLLNETGINRPITNAQVLYKFIHLLYNVEKQIAEKEIQWNGSKLIRVMPVDVSIVDHCGLFEIRY